MADASPEQDAFFVLLNALWGAVYILAPPAVFFALTRRKAKRARPKLGLYASPLALGSDGGG